MFQSAGLFRDVPCPYFLYGLCERPYCHFKHSKQEDAKARIEKAKAVIAAKEVEEYTVPTSSLQRTLQNIEQSIQSEKKKLKDGNKETSTANQSQEVTVKSIVPANKPTGTPAYNPTPLGELQKQRIEGKLGRSKYDLALLEGPASEAEYDPASNFSTSCSKGNDNQPDNENTSNLPDYAKPLHANEIGSLKRQATDDGDEDSPLAKIPKFVSVEYTPAVMETEVSDEEPLGEKGDWFSDAESEKSSASGKAPDTPENSYGVSSTRKEKKTGKQHNVLPIEFSADGSVKCVPVKPTPKTVEKKEKMKSEKDKKPEITDKKSDNNIFNLFKEEFDSAFEGIEKIENDAKVEILSSVSSKDSGIKTNSKVSNNDTKEIRKDRNSSDSSNKQKSHLDKSKSSSKYREKCDKTDISSKTVDKNNSLHKHTTENQNTHASNKSGDNKKTLLHKHNNSIPSSSKHRDNSKHSGRSQSSSSSRQINVSSSLSKSSEKNQKNSESSSKHSEKSRNSDSSLKHVEKSLKDHTRSSSHSHNLHKHPDKTLNHSEHTSKHSETPPKTTEKSSGTKHLDKQTLKNDKNSNQNRAKSDKHDEQRHSKDKHKHKDRLNGHHSKSNPSSSSHKHDKQDRDRSKHSGKKKQIMNLDVDLFGLESDGETKTNIADMNYDYEIDSDLEKYFSDEDPFDECLKIFNEEQKKALSTSMVDKKKQKNCVPEEEAPTSALGKKRIALKQSDPNDKKKDVASNKPRPRPSPAQVMMNRYKMMQERALQAEQDAKEKLKVKVKEISNKNASKIATQPSSSGGLASASIAFNSYLANKNKKTAAITAAKGNKRKAHTPTVTIEKLKRPVVEISTSSKVPTNVRQRYLNLFIDECVKLCSTDEEAFKRGKEEEAAIYKRCSNKKIYLNIAVHTIKRLRTEVTERKQQKKGGQSVAPGPLKLSHAAMLGGAQATKTTFTVNRSGGAVRLQEVDFTGADLYKRLQPYIMTLDQLKENNFPHPGTGGVAVFHGVQRVPAMQGTTKGYEKLCLRCGRVFEVYPNGKYPIEEECVYHWGKAWKKKIAGSIETRYTCCSGDLQSDGCQVAKAHVHETNKNENTGGFMKTIPSSPPIDGDYGVYAIDCEMVYTTMGIELARVTVVGADQETVYESLIQPDNRVVDCNTRFSGITDEDLLDVRTTIRDVQAVLLSLFTDKTILMGHSLESDLTALKLIHFTVVDTSIVFPHRMGLPYKRALRNLMVDYLKKIIQDDVGGHDSQEDAVACLLLMQYKLKEDARKEIRRLSS